MKKHTTLTKLAVLSFLLVVLSQMALHAGPTILLVGDSTVATQATSSGAGPGRGWGQVIPEFFNADVAVKNAASNGRSSKSFIDEGRWAAAIALKPDYVFILWGSNDNNADPARHTDPATTFRDYLRRYIDDSIAAGAVPVLVTPSAMRMFTPGGTIKNSLAPYVEAMKEAASEKKVALIDLNAASVALYEQLGPEESAKLGATPDEKNHFNEEGARKISKLIADAIPENVPALKPFLAPPK